MERYGQFCPVSMASEVLDRRWTMLVVRELLAGSHRFNDLRRGLPLISPSVLSSRLDELEQLQIVRREGAEYHLTDAGEELRGVIEQLGVWGRRWARRDYDPEDLDPGLLMWDIRRRVNLDKVPAPRVVVAFHLFDAAPGERSYWLVLKPEEADLCRSDPGFDVDLRVSSDVRTLTDVWMGDRTLGGAMTQQAIRVHGPSHLQRQLTTWLKLNQFADVASARTGPALRLLPSTLDPSQCHRSGAHQRLRRARAHLDH